MRIDSPVMTNAIITGSFSGSFVGSGNFTGLEADSVEFANVLNKPTLISSSAQLADDFLDTLGDGVISSSAQVTLTSVSGYDANEHIDHTGVTLTAGNGLTGGGTIAASRTFAVGAGDGITVNANDVAVDATVLRTTGDGVVSGSAQVVALVEAGTDSNTFTDADHTKLNGIEASADVTDTANVTAAGALMDSELTSIADVKALDQSVISGASPTFSTANMTDASNKRFMTDAQETKLDSVESNADVTDTANVTSAGALMDSEVTSLSGIKSLTVPDSTTISSFGATLVDDANAAAARTTLGVDAAGTDNSTDVTLVTTSHDYLSLSGQAITLGTIDISDDTNLAVSDTTGQTGINLTLSGDTLSGVVSGLDTSDNVQFNNLTVAGNLTVTGTTTSVESTNLDVTDKLISINKGGADAASANGAGLYISGANESLTWDNGNSRFTFSDDLNVGGNITLSGTVDGRDVATDGTKLDGIEASADVTDTANVTAAGALMDSEVTNLAQVKAFDSSDYATAAQGTTADAALARSGGQMTGNITFSGAQTVDGRDLSADGSKLDGIEANADVTDTANVTAAGALMDSEVDADLKTFALPANTTISAFGKTLVDDADAAAARTTLGVDAAGTDNSTDVTLAGTPNYITISGQTITRNTIDIGDDTNLAVSDTSGQTGINMTLSGDTISGVVSGLGTSADVRFDSLGIGTAAPGTSGVIRATNDIVAFYSSDERLKDNVEEIPNALDKVESIRGVHFDWNDKQDVYEGHDIGVIAQDIEKVLPEIVEDRDNGYKAVKYEKLTAVLIQAVKELSAKVKELENK